MSCAHNIHHVRIECDNELTMVSLCKINADAIRALFYGKSMPSTEPIITCPVDGCFDRINEKSCFQCVFIKRIKSPSDLK